MKYAHIPVTYSSIFIKSEPLVGDYCNFYTYAVTDEAAALIQQWHQTSSFDDGTISGVLADYLEEHRTTILQQTTAPSPTPTAAKRLDTLIADLRHRFQSQFESSK